MGTGRRELSNFRGGGVGEQGVDFAQLPEGQMEITGSLLG